MIRGADEGYVDDSASFPATPSPSPFSPSPAQIAGFTPDQVGRQRSLEKLPNGPDKHMASTDLHVFDDLVFCQ